MTEKSRRMKRALSLLLLLSMIVSLVACRNQSAGDSPQGEQSESANPMDYTITVKDQNGKALEGLGIYVYTDSTMAELVWFAKTDADGAISFTDGESDSYIAVVNDPPEEYLTQENYPMTGANTEIVLELDPKLAGDLSRVRYELGDSVHDFTVTAPDGTEYTLSRLLEEKKAVVLNFFYQECAPCKTEFPYLQEAYEKYSDDIEVLAMNPVNTDPDALAAFRTELGVTFPMVLCDANWEKAMGIMGYPTTVVIDSFGTVSLIHTGMITDTETFEKMFAHYISENYQPGETTDLEEILEATEEYVMTVGTQDNPDEFSGVTKREITVPAGEKYYCQMYKVTKLYLSISDPDAYVIYNNKTYYPSNGTVSLLITAEDVSTVVKLIIGNSGEELKTFSMHFGIPAGTIGNPYKLTMGEVTVNVAAGNDQGVCYRYTCEKSGTIIARCISATSGVAYDCSLYNLNTYAMRTMYGDGTKDSEGRRTVSIKVNKGDVLQFNASTLPDSTGYYPAAKLKFRVEYLSDDEKAEGENTAPQEDTVTYAVTVTDANRKAIAGVQVYLLRDGTSTTAATDEAGVARAELAAGTYQVVLKMPNGYKAKTTELILTEESPYASIKADEVESEPLESTMLTNIGLAYYVKEGETKVELASSSTAEIYNYFVFRPERTGLYQVTTADPKDKVSDWATTVFPYNATEDLQNNTFEVNVKQLSDDLGYVIGVVGEGSCTLMITRVGDPVLDETDAAWSEEWKQNLTEPPAKVFQLTGDGTKLTYVDLESDAKAVYNTSDGYYHLNKKNGPILYVNLGPDARYVALYSMLGFNGDAGGAQNLARYFYQEDGTFIRKEKYTDWMRQYIEMRDATYDVYPLTDTLLYMIQNGGEQMGWWNQESAAYKFEDIDLNPEIGWMFAVCYIAD